MLGACSKGRPGPEELVPADARVVGRISSFDRLDKLFAGLPVPVPAFGRFVKGAVCDRGREMLFGLRENGDTFMTVPVDNAQTAKLPFKGSTKPGPGYLGYTRSSAEIELMRNTRRMMDPHNILNPGKIFDL